MLAGGIELFVRQVGHDLKMRKGNAAESCLLDLLRDDRFRVFICQVLQSFDPEVSDKFVSKFRLRIIQYSLQ